MVEKKFSTILLGNGVEPVVKTGKDVSTQVRGSSSRAKRVRELKELGYKRWKDKYRYDY